MEYLYKFSISLRMLLLFFIIPTMFLYFLSSNDRSIVGIVFDRMNNDFKKLKQ